MTTRSIPPSVGSTHTDSRSNVSLDTPDSNSFEPTSAAIGLKPGSNRTTIDPSSKTRLRDLDKAAKQSLRSVDGIDELFLALALTDSLSLAGPAIASVLSIVAQRAVQAGAEGAKEEALELKALVEEMKEQRHDAKTAMVSIIDALEGDNPDVEQLIEQAQALASDTSSSHASTSSSGVDEPLPPMQRLMNRAQQALQSGALDNADQDALAQEMAVLSAEHKEASKGKRTAKIEAFFMDNCGAPAMNLMSKGMYALAGTAGAKFFSDLSEQEVSELGDIGTSGNVLGDITGVSKTAATGIFGLANTLMAAFAVSKVITGVSKRVALGKDKQAIARMNGISHDAKAYMQDRRQFEIETNRWDGAAYGVPTAIGQSLFAYSAVLEFVKNIPGPPGKNVLTSILQSPAIAASVLTLVPAVIRARQETREGKHEGNPDKVPEGTVTEPKDLFSLFRTQAAHQLKRQSNTQDADNASNTTANGAELAQEMKYSWELGFLMANEDLAKAKALSLMHYATTQHPDDPEKRLALADKLIGHGRTSTFNVGIKKHTATLGLKADTIPLSIKASQRTTIRGKVQMNMQQQYGNVNPEGLRHILENPRASHTDIYKAIASELHQNSPSHIVSRLKEFENESYNPVEKLAQALALSVLNKPLSPVEKRDETRALAIKKIVSLLEKSHDLGGSPSDKVDQFRRAVTELNENKPKRFTRRTGHVTRKAFASLRKRIPGASQRSSGSSLISQSSLSQEARLSVAYLSDDISDTELMSLFSQTHNKTDVRRLANELIQTDRHPFNEVNHARNIRTQAHNLLAQHYLMDMAAVVFKKVPDPRERLAEMDKAVSGKSQFLPNILTTLAKQSLPDHFLRNIKDQYRNDRAGFETLFQTLGQGHFITEKENLSVRLGYSTPLEYSPRNTSTGAIEKTKIGLKAEKELLRLVNLAYDRSDDPEERMHTLEKLVKGKVKYAKTAIKRARNPGLSQEINALFTRDRAAFQELLATPKGRPGNDQETRQFMLGVRALAQDNNYFISEHRPPIVEGNSDDRVADDDAVISHRQGETKHQYVLNVNQYIHAMEQDPSLAPTFDEVASKLLISCEKNLAKVKASTHAGALSYIRSFEESYQQLSRPAAHHSSPPSSSPLPAQQQASTDEPTRANPQGLSPKHKTVNPRTTNKDTPTPASIRPSINRFNSSELFQSSSIGRLTPIIEGSDESSTMPDSSTSDQKPVKPLGSAVLPQKKPPSFSEVNRDLPRERSEDQKKMSPQELKARLWQVPDPGRSSGR